MEAKMKTLERDGLREGEREKGERERERERLPRWDLRHQRYGLGLKMDQLDHSSYCCCWVS